MKTSIWIGAAVSLARTRLISPAVADRLLICGAISIAAFVSSILPAAAVPVLPNAYITNSINPPDQFGSHSYDPCSGNSGSNCPISYTASYANGDMSISTTATATNAGDMYQLAGFFFFEIVGPSGNPFVPVIISASAATSAGPDSLDEALVATTNANPGFSMRAASCDPVTIPASFCENVTGGGNPPTSFSGNYSVNIEANAESQFEEFLRVYDFSSASASIDPMIEIDPTWLAANPGYSLIFSPNVAGVPEPLTLSIFAAGLAGAAAMRRRKKATA